MVAAAIAGTSGLKNTRAQRVRARRRAEVSQAGRCRGPGAGRQVCSLSVRQAHGPLQRERPSARDVGVFNEITLKQGRKRANKTFRHSWQPDSSSSADLPPVPRGSSPGARAAGAQLGGVGPCPQRTRGRPAPPATSTRGCTHLTGEGRDGPGQASGRVCGGGGPVFPRKKQEGSFRLKETAKGHRLQFPHCGQRHPLCSQIKHKK